MNSLYNVFEQQKGTRVPPEEYAKQKHEQKEELLKMAYDMVDKIAIDPNVYQQYLNMQVMFDKYTVTNTLLIMAQKPDATYIKGFEEWSSKKCYIKKNDKAFQIFDGNGKEYTRPDGTKGVDYPIKNMFDISQIKIPPMLQQKKHLSSAELLSALTYKCPVGISVVEKESNAIGVFYNSEQQRIEVLPNLSDIELLKGLAHELCYAQMDNFNGTYNRDTYAFFADSSSYMLCQKLQIANNDTDFLNNANAYFKEADPKDVRECLMMTKGNYDEVNKRVMHGIYAQQENVKKPSEQER